MRARAFLAITRTTEQREIIQASVLQRFTSRHKKKTYLRVYTSPLPPPSLSLSQFFFARSACTPPSKWMMQRVSRASRRCTKDSVCLQSPDFASSQSHVHTFVGRKKLPRSVCGAMQPAATERLQNGTAGCCWIQLDLMCTMISIDNTIEFWIR